MLPSLSELETDLSESIGKNKSAMVQTETTYDAKIEPAKKKKDDSGNDETNGES